MVAVNNLLGISNGGPFEENNLNLTMPVLIKLNVYSVVSLQNCLYRLSDFFSLSRSLTHLYKFIVERFIFVVVGVSVSCSVQLQANFSEIYLKICALLRYTHVLTMNTKIISNTHETSSMLQIDMHIHITHMKYCGLDQ